jgi:pimeloyl-ACP methyl ester carboxylesterase
MPQTSANGVDIEFEVLGDTSDPTVLLVAGLGAQLVSWDDEFCARLIDRGMSLVRFDNRDVGLSGSVDDGRDPMALVASRLSGEEVDAPYLLSDMANDAMAVLDAVGVEHAHVMGMSMGGMIAQTIAIEHGHRVRSLTSIMSTTGDPDVGLPDPAVLGTVLAPAPADDPAAAVEHKLRISAAIGSPGMFDADRARRRAEREVARSVNPLGTVRQLVAIMSSPSRSAALRSVDVPALVVHGDVDPLVNVSGGRRTHECLPAAELMVFEGMGHDLPPAFWDPLADAVAGLTRR